MKKYILIISIFVLILGLVGYYQKDNIISWFFRPKEIEVDKGVGENDLEPEEIKILAEGLNVPWDMVFIDDATFLVTERSGILKLYQNEELKKEIPVDNVNQIGEGGLMGLALHPDFNQNNFLYLYKTTRSGGQNINVVERYIFKGEALSAKKVIIDNIPGASTHNGGRLAFGPDGYLYATTGDAQTTSLSQNTASLAGKILRVTDEGTIPSDNPFKSAVYSYGHRNPQGITWDAAGNLWATEHGSSARDELNLIEKGKNYGWPTITGSETRSGMEAPKIHSGSDTWAPSGIAYLDGRLFFSGLRGNAIFEAIVNDKEVTLKKAHFREDYGRIRFVKIGPDGFIYFGTNNRDGRGQPKAGDDKILRVDPKLFK